MYKAKFLGIEELGTLYKNDKELSLPLNNEQIPLFNESEDILEYTIGNTSTNLNNKLKWIKVKDGGKIIYICDRCILKNITSDDLEKAGYIKGRKIKINNKNYICRLLHDDDRLNGIIDKNNEWNRFVVNNDGIANLSTSDSFYHWKDIWTMTDGTNGSNRISRGYASINGIDWWCFSYRNENIGWRPILEVQNTKFLLEQSNQIYTLKTEFYDITKKQYKPITELDINNISKEDILKYGFDDIESLLNEISIGTESFKPLNKLKLINNGKFNILMKERY